MLMKDKISIIVKELLYMGCRTTVHPRYIIDTYVNRSIQDGALAGAYINHNNDIPENSGRCPSRSLYKYMIKVT